VTEQQRKKLKAHYRALSSLHLQFQQLVKDKLGGTAFLSGPAEQVENEIRELAADFPELVPKPPTEIYSYHATDGQAYLSRVLSRLSVELESFEHSAVVDQLEFNFVTDSELRRIVARDFEEAQRAYISQCWKSVIILTGGAIEAVLLDALSFRSSDAIRASSAPKGKSDLTKWDFFDLARVAVELKIVDPSALTLSDPVRQYRNLVHPGVEKRTHMKPDKLEAENGLNVLRIIHRDLAS
jgi:hypothetical protein